MTRLLPDPRKKGSCTSEHVVHSPRLPGGKLTLRCSLPDGHDGKHTGSAWFDWETLRTSAVPHVWTDGVIPPLGWRAYRGSE